MKRLSVLLALVLLSPALQAKAMLCGASMEVGVWQRISPAGEKTPEIEELKISNIFQPVAPGSRVIPCRFNPDKTDIDNPDKGPEWHVEITGTCDTGQCSWATVGAEQVRREAEMVETIYGTGWLRPIFASFDRGNLRLDLYIQAAPQEAGILNVNIYTHHLDGHLPDAVDRIRFRRRDAVETSERPQTIQLQIPRDENGKPIGTH